MGVGKRDRDGVATVTSLAVPKMSTRGVYASWDASPAGRWPPWSRRPGPLACSARVARGRFAPLLLQSGTWRMSRWSSTGPIWPSCWGTRGPCRRGGGRTARTPGSSLRSPCPRTPSCRSPQSVGPAPRAAPASCRALPYSPVPATGCEGASEKSWSAVHKLGAAAGSGKPMGGTWCRPYLAQMPGGAGRMPGFFPVSGIILPNFLSGT
jgi:hypothetical protein